MRVSSLVLNAVLDQIMDECNYQSEKWGETHIRQQSVEGHLLILRAELQEAVNGWLKNSEGRSSVESELTQVAAVAFQALINLKLEQMLREENEED